MTAKILNNILVVRTDRIGDVVLTTPSLTLLRQTFPDTKITLLVSPLTKDLVATNSDVDEIFIDDRLGSHKGLGFFNLAGELRKRKFDLAVIYHTKRRTNLLCFLAGIPRRLGYKNNKFGFLLSEPVLDERHTGQKHEAQYCLDLLKGLGVEGELSSPKVCVQENARSWVDDVLRNKGVSDKDLIAIHCGASDASKCWPVENFVDLVETMSQKYDCKFVLIGAKNTSADAARIQAAAGSRALDLTGQTSVAQLAAVLERCRVLVSNDSGPVHVADALQVPVISIFTRNIPGINPERWRPLNPQNIALFPAPQPEISFADPTKVDLSKLDFIPVKQVLESVDSLFKLC